MPSRCHSRGTCAAALCARRIWYCDCPPWHLRFIVATCWLLSHRVTKRHRTQLIASCGGERKKLGQFRLVNSNSTFFDSIPLIPIPFFYNSDCDSILFLTSWQLAVVRAAMIDRERMLWALISHFFGSMHFQFWLNQLSQKSLPL